MTTEATIQQGNRTPVHDPAYERVVLGTMMTSPATIDTIRERLTCDDFYNPRHGEVFTAICAAHESGEPTEPIALTARFVDAGTINRIGGAEFLHQCYAEVPVAAQIDHYVNRVAELAERRVWEAKGVRLVQAATTPGTVDIAAMAEELLSNTKPRTQNTTEMVQLGSLIVSSFDQIELRKDAPSGIPTGFADLDRLLGGLRKKQLVTIAAPTGAGKSIFLTDIARHLAIKNKYSVAYFSLEMSNDEVFERILSAEAGISAQTIRDGTMSDTDWQKASSKIGPLSTAPLFMCDDTEITVHQIKTRCQILARKVGLDAVIVDYTQLVTPSRSYSNEQQAISDVSASLKRMAGTLDVPVIAAAQMNRGPDMRADKLPQLHDLRGSGSIANDSNVVVFVHRPDYYDPESPRRGEADLVVAKARSAPKDTVTVASQLHYSRFVDMAVI